MAVQRRDGLKEEREALFAQAAPQFLVEADDLDGQFILAAAGGNDGPFADRPVEADALTPFPKTAEDHAQEQVEHGIAVVDAVVHQIVADDDGLDRVAGGGGGGAHTAVDQRHLADDLAGAEHGQTQVATVDQRGDDHVATFDDVGTFPGLALAEQGGAGTETPPVVAVGLRAVGGSIVVHVMRPAGRPSPRKTPGLTAGEGGS